MSFHSLLAEYHTREDLTMLATVLAATMCDLTASVPCCLFFFPWLFYEKIPVSPIYQPPLTLNGILKRRIRHSGERTRERQ